MAEALRVLPLLQSVSLTFGAACHLPHLLALDHLSELRGELRVDARDFDEVCTQLRTLKRRRPDLEADVKVTPKPLPPQHFVWRKAK